MYNKEYYIKNIQEKVFSFNEYWEDPVVDSTLVKEPSDTAELIISYCNTLNIKNRVKCERNINGYGNDYNQFPEDIKNTIQEIISLVSDGRPLRTKTLYEKCNCLLSDETQEREYDHHVEKNGRLPFENNWQERIDGIIDACEKLINVVASEKETVNYDKFVGKSLEYNHYESGSYVITIDKINKDKGVFTFDGKIVYYATVDSQFDLDGILMERVDDYKFEDLPYVEEFESDEDFVEFLESGEEKTLIELVNDLRDSITCYFEQTFGVEVS